MQINQDLMIIYRNNHVLLSHISGSIKPMPIYDPDILLIEKLLNQGEIEEKVKRFVSDPLVKKLIPKVTTKTVSERIQQLKEGRAFTNTKQAARADSQLIRLIQNPIEIPDHLSLSTNMGISLCARGYFAYSRYDNAPVLLPASWVLLMLAFGNGRSYKDVIKDKKALVFDNSLQVLGTLYKHGFLIKQKRNIKRETNKLSDYATITSEHNLDSWQELQADGRIPVYFVPHMENHYPLALGILHNALENYEDGALLKHFQLIPISYLEPNELLNGPYRKFGTGVWLFSNYMWSLAINLQISRAVKDHNSKNLTIHGGPSTPDYQQASKEFMFSNSSVDISVHGEGELAITEIFQQIIRSSSSDITYRQENLASVPGITFRNKQSEGEDLIRTPIRIRTKTPDSVPSPYLTGAFDNYNGRVEAAIIESNRGCPFGCTFCDWGSATNQKIRKFDLDRVKQEIEWIGKNKVRVIWIADANFGIYDRDIELSQFIADTKLKYGYPQEVVVNYTKNSTWRLVEIIKIFTASNIISQGIISIQTTDTQTLEVINRRNIKTEKYDELVDIFNNLNLPLSTDLMIGLPGMTKESFKNDLQHYINLDVSVKAYPTQLLPNSPMADPDYIKKYKIKVDENDFVISSFSFTEDDLLWMKGLYQIYMVADGYSLLRYVIRYLQWEHDISASNFLCDLMLFIKKDPLRYPQISWAVIFFNQDKSMPGGWSLFYQQIAMYIKETYGIKKCSGLDTVLLVSQYSMPEDSIDYPEEIELEHDFPAYFKANSGQESKPTIPLISYPKSIFKVSDPNSMTSIDIDYSQYDSHQYFWELHSAISRPKSTSDFNEEHGN